jgi:di/tricarboxylate transporter
LSSDLRLWHRHRLRVQFARRLWAQTTELDEGEGVGQLKATLAEVVIVVLIVIFARVVVGTVELDKPFDWPMLVLPASIFLIATALADDRARRREGIP